MESSHKSSPIAFVMNGTIYNKLLMYLNNDYYYLNPINSKKNIQLIGIHKIKGKYF